MPTTKKLDNLNVNVLTKSQYDTAVAQGIITDEDLSMITDLGNDAVPQYEQMPVASADIVNQIVQYSGATDATYTNGYFYKCVSDGQNPATYSWTRVDVQPTPDPLPSQTGQSGKFLTTDGTDASWSDKPLVNTATQTGSLAILGTAITTSSVVLGYNATSGSSSSGSAKTAVGSGASATGNGTTAIGQNAKANGTGSIAIGQGGTASANGAVQINYGTNSTPNTLQFGSYQIVSADGTVPTARLTKVNSTITLAAANWSSNTQTVGVSGVTVDGVVFVSPVPASQVDYTSAGVMCSAQAAGTLTFTCDTVPSSDLSVTVVML